MKEVDVKRSRVYEGEIHDFFEVANADFVGQLGYFAIDLHDVWKFGELQSLENDKMAYGYYCEGKKYRYFIPYKKAKFVGEHYRRFKYLDELPFNLGEVILYRLKGETGSESKALITEVSYTNDEKCAIYCIGIGNKMLTTHECFADLELYNDECEWQPFGVIDNE